VLAAALLPRLLLTGLLALLAGLLLAALLLAGLLLAALLLTGLLLATLLLLAAVLLAALLSAALPTLIGIVHDRSCGDIAPPTKDKTTDAADGSACGDMLPLSRAQSQARGSSKAREGRGNAHMWAEGLDREGNSCSGSRNSRHNKE